jgi:hypothetical protein
MSPSEREILGHIVKLVRGLARRAAKMIVSFVRAQVVKIDLRLRLTCYSAAPVDVRSRVAGTVPPARAHRERLPSSHQFVLRVRFKIAGVMSLMQLT